MISIWYIHNIENNWGNSGNSCGLLIKHKISFIIKSEIAFVISPSLKSRSKPQIGPFWWLVNMAFENFVHNFYKFYKSKIKKTNEKQKY